MKTCICKNGLNRYNSLVKTTRQRLWEYLQVKQGASAEELALVLQVTPANVRHHLSALISEGLVEKVGKRLAGKRGRPVQLYSLVEQISRHNLVNLVKGLLNVLEEGRSLEERDQLLNRLAGWMAKDGRGPALSSGQRYYQAIQFLNSNNYKARWEAHAKAPHVIFSHCPYRTILQDHPEMCRLDAYLLEELLGERAVQAAKLELTSHGTRQCVFLIGKRALNQKPGL
jgi:predicted ArsR family transcriptional regulator